MVWDARGLTETQPVTKAPLEHLTTLKLWVVLRLVVNSSCKSAGFVLSVVENWGNGGDNVLVSPHPKFLETLQEIKLRGTRKGSREATSQPKAHDQRDVVVGPRPEVKITATRACLEKGRGSLHQVPVARAPSRNVDIIVRMYRISDDTRQPSQHRANQGHL